MLELASLGAGVMHTRSIEFAKKFNVPIHVRNSQSFSDEPGTDHRRRLREQPTAPSPAPPSRRTKPASRITGVPDKPGTSFAIFSRLAAVNVPST